MRGVTIYDNGGQSFDRFTAIYSGLPRERDGTFQARAMSENPFHPLGFGQWTSAQPGRHLGKRIRFSELPVNCQKLILQDLEQ